MLGPPASKSLWPFSPQSIPGLSLWLDAADTSTITGTSPITNWRDKSGNANNATATGSPTLAQNSINGVQSIATYYGNYFTGSISITGTSLTCFAVATTSSSMPLYGSDQRLVSLANGANTDFGETGGDIALFNQSGTNTIATYRVYNTLASNPIIQNNPFLAVSQYDGTNGYLWFNGSAGTLPSSESTGTFSITKYGIGDQANPTYESWIGNIGEVIIFNTDLNTSQRQQVEGYLAQKWGLQPALPATHPYYAIAPISTLPTSIPGLSLWLDPSDSTTIVSVASGIYLGSIRDKSGSGNLWTSVTPYTIQLNIPLINGKQVLGFLNGYYLTGTYTLTSGYNSTIFVVVKAQPNDNITIFGDSGPSIVLPAPSGEGYLEMYYPPDYDYDGYAYSIQYKSNITYIICVSISAIDSGSAVCTVNGTEYLVEFYGGTLPTSDEITITTSTTGSNNSSIVMGDILVYSSALTTSQRQQVEGCLAWKWGIQSNLPPSHPYYALSALQLYKRPVFQRTFQPVDIDGCVLWLDGADQQSMTFSSGTTVSVWKDKSGNGYNATQASEKTLGTYSSEFNCIYFPESTTAYVTSYPANPTSETMFVVANNGSPDVNNCTLIGGPYGVRALGFGYSGNGGSGTHGYLQNEVAWLAPTPNGSYTAGTTALVTGQVSGGNTYISTQGDVMSSGYGISGGAFASGDTYLGTDTTNPSYYYIGYVMEIIFYDSVLSLSQRQQVESYLAWKWGLVTDLTTGHPGKLLPSFSSVFTPKSLSNMVLWLDAADSSTITLSGGSVTKWSDKSGSGYVATPIDSAITTTTLNGTPALLFGWNRMTIPNFTWNMSFTSIMVWNAYYGSQMIGLGASTNSAAAWYDYISVGNWALIMLNNNATNSTDPNYTTDGHPSTVVTPNQWFIFSIGYTAGTTTITNYSVNGSARTANSVTAQTGSNTGAYIINGLPNSAYDFSQVGEIIHYNTSLTSSERQQVEGYLAWKWGLQNNLPDTHAYKKIKP